MPLTEVVRDQPGDDVLVERTRAGDLDAFDALVVRYMDRAYGAAYRLMKQRQDAEDLVQEAFIQALQTLDRFDARRPFAPWFFRILLNRGLNLRRSRGVRATEEMPEELPAHGESPERLAERRELRDGIRAAMAALGERERVIIELFELEGFDSGEIAGILDMPRGTVRWHLHQARQVLREKLVAFHGSES